MYEFEKAEDARKFIAKIKKDKKEMIDKRRRVV